MPNQLPNETGDPDDKQLLVEQPLIGNFCFSQSLNAELEVPVSHSFDKTLTLTVLYVFAGKERQSDIHCFLKERQQSVSFELKMHEVDILRDPSLDVTNEKLVESLLREIDSQVYDVIIVTPL